MADDSFNDAGLALRKQAATRLASFAQQQISLSTSLVTAFTQHSSASLGLIAKMVETGDFHLKQWVSNAVALSIETWGATYDACSNAGPAPVVPDPVHGNVTGQRTAITLTADDQKEVAGPTSLGIPAAELSSLHVTPLLDAAGGPAGAAKLLLTTRGNEVFIEIDDIRLNENPLPAGTYTGTVTRAEGGATTVIATITLARI